MIDSIHRGLYNYNHNIFYLNNQEWRKLLLISHFCEIVQRNAKRTLVLFLPPCYHSDTNKEDLRQDTGI